MTMMYFSWKASILSLWLLPNPSMESFSGISCHLIFILRFIIEALRSVNFFLNNKHSSSFETFCHFHELILVAVHFTFSLLNRSILISNISPLYSRRVRWWPHFPWSLRRGLSAPPHLSGGLCYHHGVCGVRELLRAMPLPIRYVREHQRPVRQDRGVRVPGRRGQHLPTGIHKHRWRELC